MKPEREIEHAATQLLETKFLPLAESSEAAERIDHDLDDKILKVGGRRLQYREQLMSLLRQAKWLWGRRGELDRKHVTMLGAALLYFLSPMDFLPDVIPGLGYVDDLAVLAYVLKTITQSIGPMRDALIERATSSVVDKGRRVLENVIDTRLDEIDRVSRYAVRRYIAVVAIGLWGTTTAAAISLVMVMATGQYAIEWAVYAAVTSAFVGFWNISTAIGYFREFRRLHGDTQTRLVKLVAAHTRKRDLVAIVVPVLVLLSLFVARLILPS
jgi:uncharacterized membrane protein YkvA (DUF1232 family)